MGKLPMPLSGLHEHFWANTAETVGCCGVMGVEFGLCIESGASLRAMGGMDSDQRIHRKNLLLYVNAGA